MKTLQERKQTAHSIPPADETPRGDGERAEVPPEASETAPETTVPTRPENAQPARGEPTPAVNETARPEPPPERMLPTRQNGLEVSF
ncbi:MAG: hypothetical protein M3430_18460 [Acidobacteriota bacterium]|nr:hypothetical protein [Acidobacteriota bacterium]